VIKVEDSENLKILRNALRKLRFVSFKA